MVCLVNLVNLGVVPDLVVVGSFLWFGLVSMLKYVVSNGVHVRYRIG